MLFDMRGVDFFRLQRQNQGRVGDVLDPDVLYSGEYEDGQGVYLQVAVDAPGTANGKSYDLGFGRTYNRPPVVFGTLRLTQGLNQNNTQFFNAGECIAPCSFRRNVFGVGVVVNYLFNFSVYTNRVTVGVTGFTGIATFICFETS